MPRSMFSVQGTRVTVAVQVISLSLDGVIRVWDLQTHRCLQALEPDRVRPTAMLYDAARQSLVMGR